MELWEQTITITVLVTAMVMKVYKHHLSLVTEKFQDRTDRLTQGVLALYLVDYLLLLAFGTSVPPLHESGWVGISCSLLLMVVVVMNILCGLARRNVDSGDDGQQEQRLTSVFVIGVCIFWLCIEVMGWLLKIQP